MARCTRGKLCNHPLSIQIGRYSCNCLSLDLPASSLRIRVYPCLSFVALCEVGIRGCPPCKVFVVPYGILTPQNPLTYRVGSAIGIFAPKTALSPRNSPPFAAGTLIAHPTSVFIRLRSQCERACRGGALARRAADGVLP